MRTAGFVLAGGASRRMGQDKALLEFHGIPLLAAIAGTIESTVGSAIIIGDPSRYSHLGWKVIPDRRQNCGPLAGIETALMESDAQRNLFVACDMPDVSAELLKTLVNTPLADCVLPQTPDGRIHPLCAVWDRKLLSAVQSSLDTGRLRVLDALQGADVKVIHIERLSNANTPEEWRTLTEVPRG